MVVVFFFLTEPEIVKTDSVKPNGSCADVFKLYPNLMIYIN